MSLDVYLKGPSKTNIPPKIFIRENGRTVEISQQKWNELHPNQPPFKAPSTKSNTIYNGNITHNLNDMAKQADLYMPIWRPDEIDITKAHQLIPILTDGLARLKADPIKFRSFNPANGWGSYETLLEFVEEYLTACTLYPDADVSTWR